MGMPATNVVPFTQVRANLSELPEQDKVEAEKIITKNGENYVALGSLRPTGLGHQQEREWAVAAESNVGTASGSGHKTVSSNGTARSGTGQGSIRSTLFKEPRDT